MFTNAGNDLNGKTLHELNYVTTNRFYVEIGGTIAASFTECSELSVVIQKEVYHEGGVNDQQRVVLKHTEFADVTLKRGITDDLTFWKWLSEIFQGKNTRRNVNIIVFNQAGEIMRSWTLIGAIPVGWKTPAFQADGNAVAIEELTLAYESLKIGKDSGGGNSTTRDGKGFFSSS